jgi:hypothetical protein
LLLFAEILLFCDCGHPPAKLDFEDFEAPLSLTLSFMAQQGIFQGKFLNAF